MTEVNLEYRDDSLEEMEEFCYLGSRVTKVGKSKKEIRTRIAKENAHFNKEKRLFPSVFFI